MQPDETFNRFYWWALAYDVCCIVGVTVVILSASQDTYQLAVRHFRALFDTQLTRTSQLVGFLSVALTYNTFAVSSVVFSTEGVQEAAAAGYILLSMVSVSKMLFRFVAEC